MRYRLLVLSVLLSVAILQPATSHLLLTTPGAATASHPPVAQTLTGTDFDSGVRKNVVRTNAGELTPTAATGSFTSNIMAAPQAFNYLQLHWNATIPVSASVTIEGRVSPDQQSWSKWGELAVDDDFLDPRDPAGTYWSGVVFAGNARFWQLRVSLIRTPAGTSPRLQKIIVRMVDARDGKQFKPATSGVHPAATIGQPTFVSRWQWGGSEVANNSVPPDYYQANHLVVHHTADSNTLVPGESSWADRVMAEWRFHTYSTNGGRGWGDVGYNWLIDPNGVIYEGRWGSSDLTQDAVGFHDTANYGSMGVVLLGTFDTVTPTSAAQNSLVNLLAWKAQQRQIDPFGSSYYYGCANSSYCAPYHPGAIVLNLAGHRDVLPNHTDCPGDQGISILPSIRQQVANLATPSDNGDNVIDDTESGFTQLAGSWHDTPSGYNGHSYYTYNLAGTAQNKAQWNWTPNPAQSGTYKIEAFIPRDSGLTTPLTQSAHYTINSSSGSTTVTINQVGTSEWLDLGNYQFDGTAGGSVYLDDSTGEPDLSTMIFFDAIRWTYIPAPPQPQIQLVNFQASPTTVTAGEVVRISFTVKNTGTTVLSTQDPLPGTPGDLTSGYVYDEGECFLSNAGQTYPTLAKVTGRFRITMGGLEGSTALGADCQGDNGGHPWRWGLGNDLQPGETRTVVGAIRFQNYTVNNRTIALSANLINENVAYILPQDVPVATITVQPEKHAPQPSQIGSLGFALAQVYTMKVMPQSLLARTANPLSVDEDQLVGSIRWDGSDQGWGAGGPLGQTDQFIVEQARPFFAPSTGTYTFEMTTDDGAWFWIDGSLVLDNHGLHIGTSVTNTVFLQSGWHSLGFKYFEYFGLAQAEYSWQPPGASALSTIPVLPTATTVSNQIVIGAGQTLVLSADDLGGSGITQLTYWIDGGSQQIVAVAGSVIPLVSLPGLPDGPHSVRFNATDWAGNVTPDQTINFTMNAYPPQTTLTAQLLASGAIQLQWTSNPDVQNFVFKFKDSSTGVWNASTPMMGHSLLYLGTPGHSYQFVVTANDGIYTADSNTTQSMTVPANAHFSRNFMPVMRH